MSKLPPTRTYCKRNRPLPYYHPKCRTPRHWKFTQDLRTTRPPLAVLVPGDRVLVKNHEKVGPGKIRSFWNVYVVFRRIGESPVYKVRREDGSGPVRTLHQNLLFQCNSLPIEKQKHRQVICKRVRNAKAKRTNASREDSSSESDSVIVKESSLNTEVFPF